MSAAASSRSRSGKRGNGEGTIYQRNDTGLWCTAVTLANGKRKYLYGRTREEVARKLTKVLRDLQDGIAPADRRETVASWVEKYIDDLEARRTAHATVKRYRGILRNYLQPELGRMRLADVQPQHVLSFLGVLFWCGFVWSLFFFF